MAVHECDSIILLLFVSRRGVNRRIEERKGRTLPESHVVCDFIILFVRQLVLFLRWLVDDLLIHESIGFHIHTFDPINHGNLVDDRF